jgi:hypothetical protein
MVAMKGCCMSGSRNGAPLLAVDQTAEHVLLTAHALAQSRSGGLTDDAGERDDVVTMLTAAADRENILAPEFFTRNASKSRCLSVWRL